MENIKQLALTYAIQSIANNPCEEFIREPGEFFEFVREIEAYILEGEKTSSTDIIQMIRPS